MNKSYEVITALCKGKGITYNYMCKQLNISPSTIGNLKSNPDRVLNAKYAAMIANYLGVTVNYILYGGEIEKPATTTGDGLDLSALTADQRQVIQEVLQMDSQSLSAARPLIESLLFSQQARETELQSE